MPSAPPRRRASIEPTRLLSCVASRFSFLNGFATWRAGLKFWSHQSFERGFALHLARRIGSSGHRPQRADLRRSRPAAAETPGQGGLDIWAHDLLICPPPRRSRQASERGAPPARPSGCGPCCSAATPAPILPDAAGRCHLWQPPHVAHAARCPSWRRRRIGNGGGAVGPRAKALGGHKTAPPCCPARRRKS